MNFKSIWAKIHSKDLYTWLGHGILGFALTFLFGYLFTPGAFVYREVSDIIGWTQKDPATRRPWDVAVKDGFFDLWAPLAGAAIAEIVKAL